MNYQSAFAAPRAPKDKPGLLCHAAAVDHYAARGLALYSLIAGKDRYKQSLATREEALEWAQVDRFSRRLEAEPALRSLLSCPASRCCGRRSAAPTAPPSSSAPARPVARASPTGRSGRTTHPPP